MLGLKIPLALIYLWGIAGLIVPESIPGGDMAWKVLLGLIVIHTLELPLMLKDFRKTGEPLGKHIAQAMVFGVIHWHSVRIGLQEAEEGGDGG